MDAFADVFGETRGATAAQPAAPTDGRPEPMSTEQVLATVKFLAPEVAARAEAHTKAWREGPAAAWVIAYLVYRGGREPMVERWWRSVGASFWTGCGLRSRPSLDEARRFFASVHEQMAGAPTTVCCLAELIADLAACGVAPVTRIDPVTLSTQRAPKLIRG